MRLSRKNFALTVGSSGGAVLSGFPTLARAASEGEPVKIGFISPRTGPLAQFGESDPYIVGLFREALEKRLSIGGKTYAVQIFDHDTQSDPARAGQLAKELINSERVDLMLATSTPETVNPVSDACEAAGVPCLSTVMPWEAWYYGRGAKPGAPSPFKWTYHFSFGVKTFLDVYVSQWHQLPTNKKVGVLYPNDADGNAIRAHLIPALEKAGFTVVDPGAYEDGTTDYSALITKFKSENCQIFNSFPLPPDFATFWRQAAQQGYTKDVIIAQTAKTGLFPSSIETLGSLGNKLASACYWHREFPYASNLTGLSSRKLADGYERESGKQWNQQLGASMALIDAGIQTLKNSEDPKSKTAVVKALRTLSMTTMIGKINFTTGPVPNVSETPSIGAQWIKSKPGSTFPFDLLITENAGDPNVPVGAKLVPYN